MIANQDLNPEYHRIAVAADTLASPHASPRAKRSAEVGLFRGLRALARRTGDPDLATASRFYLNYIETSRRVRASQ